MMIKRKGAFLLIRSGYWLGIAADAIWAVGLLYLPVFRILTVRPGFDPDLQTRSIMGIGGSLMTGWTILLLWAVRKPIERRTVILITAYPVVLGMFMVSLMGLLSGNVSTIWILIKTVVLMVSMTVSYILASKIAKEEQIAP